MGKITSYAVLSSPQSDDVLVIVDIHDTTMAPTGTDKQVTVQALLNNLANLASASTARTNLGLGSAAVQNTTAFDAAGAATAVANAIAAEIGAANGIASLDGSGHVPSAQLALALLLAGGTMGGKLAPKVATALTDGSSVPIDASAGNVFDWPLGGASHTLAAPSNPVDGQVITVRIKYGGSFVPLFAAVYDFGTAGAPAWTATSGKSDEVAFRYDAAANSNAGAWRCLNSGGLGYAS